jgi:hypothetical protein
MTVAVKKMRPNGSEGANCSDGLQVKPFPHARTGSLEQPAAVKGALLLVAAKRTLDGEDRSKTIEKRERRGERLTGGAASLLPSLTATNISDRSFLRRSGHAIGLPWSLPDEVSLDGASLNQVKNRSQRARIPGALCSPYVTLWQGISLLRRKSGGTVMCSFAGLKSDRS